MKPFELATERTQGENYATAGCVDLFVDEIYFSLDHFYDDNPNIDASSPHDLNLMPFVDELLRSLRSRFCGLLHLMGYDVTYDKNSHTSFGNQVYLAAALLDPMFRDLWVDRFIPVDQRIALKKKVNPAKK